MVNCSPEIHLFVYNDIEGKMDGILCLVVCRR